MKKRRLIRVPGMQKKLPTTRRGADYAATLPTDGNQWSPPREEWVMHRNQEKRWYEYRHPAIDDWVMSLDGLKNFQVMRKDAIHAPAGIGWRSSSDAIACIYNNIARERDMKRESLSRRSNRQVLRNLNAIMDAAARVEMPSNNTWPGPMSKLTWTFEGDNKYLNNSPLHIYRVIAEEPPEWIITIDGIVIPRLTLPNYGRATAWCHHHCQLRQQDIENPATGVV